MVKNQIKNIKITKLYKNKQLSSIQLFLNKKYFFRYFQQSYTPNFMKNQFNFLKKPSKEAISYVPFHIKQNIQQNLCQNRQIQVQTQNFKVKGYLTPNYLNSKYCYQKRASLKNDRNNPKLQTKNFNNFQKFMFSNNKEYLSVNNKNNQIKTNIQNQESSNKFIPKFRFYRQQKIEKNLIQEQFKHIKTIDTQLCQLDQKADKQIEQIDKMGKKMMKQLNTKFTDIMKFLNWQKQNCVQLILQKLDEMKQPLQNIKGSINKERWSLDTIEAKLMLIQSQEVKPTMEFVKKTIDTYNQKIYEIIKSKDNFTYLINEAKQTSNKNKSQQMGSVQKIVQTVYKKFFVHSFNSTKAQQKEELNIKLSQSQCIQQQKGEIEISSIKKNNGMSSSQRIHSNSKSLYEQLKTLENTFNQREGEQISINRFIMQNQQSNQRIFDNIPEIIRKRASQSTNFSSLTNLRQ